MVDAGPERRERVAAALPTLRAFAIPMPTVSAASRSVRGR